MDEYPIRGLVDICNRLPVNPAGGPQWSVPTSTRKGVAIHYNGPPVDLSKSDFDIVYADALYHCHKNWSTSGGVAYGDGLMYHITVWRDGTKALCRDLNAVTWHVGNPNPYYWAVMLPIGGDQQPTREQLTALGEVCDDICQWRGWERVAVKGHQELMSTDCPGGPVMAWLYGYRDGRVEVADGVNLNGFYIGHGFYDCWSQHGGVAFMGLPLSEEFDATAEDGQAVTAQWFERSRLEYVKATGEIRLARVGAEAKVALEATA